MRDTKIVELDFTAMSEAQWQDLLRARTTFIRELHPGEPVPSDDAQRQMLSGIPELRDQVTFWLVYDIDGRCVGYCALSHPKPESPDYATGKDRVYVEPVVLAPYRRQGIGTQLLVPIAQYAQAVGATWVQWDTKHASGIRFSEKLGATIAGRERTSRLDVERIDWDLMRQWVEQGESRNPGVELIRFEQLPEADLIAPYCELVTDINRLQPADDMEGFSYTFTPDELAREAERRAAQHVRHVVLCTRQLDGRLSAMTSLLYRDGNPELAVVRLTGVRREYQGRGLGKWLKAAMLFDMRQDRPAVKRVETNNFNSNHAMLSINEKMGFVLAEQLVFFKLPVQDLLTQAALLPSPD